VAHRALFVGSVGPVPAAVMRAWIGAGNSVAAFWRASAPGPIRRDRRLSWIMPQWSLAAMERKYEIPVRDVKRLSTWPEVAEEARATGADVLISVYFRYLIPREVLKVFGPQAVNFHPAPLPRYRGPQPLWAMVLDRTILTEGAMTLHVLGETFDTGPVIARTPVGLPADMNLERYTLQLSQAAARLTDDALMHYLAGELQPEPQDESRATYARPDSSERHLRLDMTVDEIRWRCRTLARVARMGVIGLTDSVKIIGFRAVVGPRTAEPPVIGRWSVEFDAADARVRLWRKLPLNGQLRRIRYLVDLARTPVL
jgi:methionyl-tRNA formyltransferase